MALIHVTDDNFETEVLKSPLPVVVDFWAEWCGPCKQIAPILEELAGEMKDVLTIKKLNIDENPKSPTVYGIRSIPALVLFVDGQVSAVKVGSLPKGQLTQWLQESLG